MLFDAMQAKVYVYNLELILAHPIQVLSKALHVIPQPPSPPKSKPSTV
jgi:hypothetical protein